MSEKTTIWNELHGYLYEHGQDVKGKICTLLDSSIPNERQVKATKDIAKQILWHSDDEVKRVIENILYDAIAAGYPLIPEWLLKEIKRQRTGEDKSASPPIEKEHSATG